MTKQLAILFFMFPFYTSCGDKSSTATAGADAAYSPRVIYGEDNRKDLFEITNPQQLEWAAATAALVDNTRIRSSEGVTQIFTDNYGETKRLCDTERFYHQKTAAFCSGFLVAPDVLVTAGHCVRTTSKCFRTKFVFGFNYSAPGEHPEEVPDDNVYSCSKLIHSEMSLGADLALIRLDRPVSSERQPLNFRRSGEPDVATPLTVIGHPSGLPTKVADGAHVLSLQEDFFLADLDTYGGNSGSAVLNSSTGEVEGILVRGERDFVWKDQCYVSNVCSDGSCSGEGVTKITEILPHLTANR